MGIFGFGKKKEEEIEEEFEDDNGPIKICQGCGQKEDSEDDKTKLKKMKQQAADGMYEFLFCRKCTRMMKKGRSPPLIAQMQAQKTKSRW